MNLEMVALMLVASLGVKDVDDVRALRLYSLAMDDPLFEDVVRMIEDGCVAAVSEARPGGENGAPKSARGRKGVDSQHLSVSLARFLSIFRSFIPDLSLSLSLA